MLGTRLFVPVNCDAIIQQHSGSWVDEAPFLLWEIGPRLVIEHWMDILYKSNDTMTLWLESPDEPLTSFVTGIFPLCRRAQVQNGVPKEPTVACTFLDTDGRITIRRGHALTSCLPDQPASRTWFALVKRWLLELQSKGTPIPELEKMIAPGVFIGHHCRISKHTQFIAPCWVGSGATISGATIGPNAVIGENAVISPGARIVESYVMSGTFVDANAELTGMVAGPRRILDHATGSGVSALENSASF